MNQAMGSAGFDGPASVIEAQVAALLQRVTQDRDLRCAQLRADVSGQAQGVLRGARKEARAAVGAAVARERTDSERVLRQAQASVLLEQRQRAQQEILSLLQEMWAEVASALELRWADPLLRKRWVRAAVRQGRTLLSAHAWRIEHGAEWPQAEVDELVKLISGADGPAADGVDMVCANDIRAGIRIRIEGACLDATIAGLLASRPQIESEFLAYYLALASAPEHREDKSA